MASHGTATQGKVWNVARLGMVLPGEAPLGKEPISQGWAWDTVRLVSAGSVEARDMVGRGRARLGKAWLGSRNHS